MEQRSEFLESDVDRSTVIRNIYVTLLFLAASLAMVTLQRGVAAQSGDTLFLWLLYVLALTSAVAIVFHPVRKT